LRVLLNRSDDVRVTWVGDGESANSEVFTASCAESNVVALVVLDQSLGEERVVLNLRLSEWRGVGRKHDELGLARPKRLEGGPVAKGVLAGLHHECQLGVDGLALHFLACGCCWCFRCHDDLAANTRVGGEGECVVRAPMC